jgi:hypothetical protein
MCHVCTSQVSDADRVGEVADLVLVYISAMLQNILSLSAVSVDLLI